MPEHLAVGSIYCLPHHMQDHAIVPIIRVDLKAHLIDECIAKCKCFKHAQFVNGIRSDRSHRLRNDIPVRRDHDLIECGKRTALGVAAQEHTA